MNTATAIATPTARPSFLVRILGTLHLVTFAVGVRTFLYQLLRVDAIRAAVASVRYFFFVVILRRYKTLNPDTGDVNANAVSHNARNLKKAQSSFAVSRSDLLIHPLSAIKISKSLPLLSIGPRTEGEILNLKAHGFRNIRAVDLITYSPWIDLGDMHALPYADNQFAMVLMGWVLTYSSNRRKAALEAIRVVRDGGLIAVGSASAAVHERDPNAPEPPKGTQWNPTLKEMLDGFQPYIDHVYFAHGLPPFPIKQWNVVAVFSVKKDANATTIPPTFANALNDMSPALAGR